MKQKLLLVFFFTCMAAAAQAQAPLAIPYQAVARNISGSPIPNQNISLRFTIHDASAGGTIVYSEMQNVTTGDGGSFNLNIGQGSVISGTFASINWGGGSKFMQVELDTAGGFSYEDMGTQQMLSVPYALYAGNTTTTGSGWNLTGNSSTNPAVNFIGTSDYVSLNFRVNNEKAGLIEVGSSANTSLGYQAFNTNLYGYDNVAIGWAALMNNVSGSLNTGSGALALYNNYTGTQNTASGSSALFSNTYGYANVANGVSALGTNISGNQNTALGTSSLFYNQAGNSGTAVGYNAMFYANNSSTPFTNYNVAVGYEALMGPSNPASNTGNSNTALGYQSLFQNSTGSYNTASGVEALGTNSYGNYNTADGVYSLLSNSGGNFNSAHGFDALYYNTSGNYNSVQGTFGLYFNDTGERNTASGSSALQDNVTGSENTGMGYLANVASGTLTNSTAVGARSQVACSNCLVLGSVNGTNGSSSNVNVGIGTNFPGAALDIKSTVSSDNLRIGDNGSSATYFKIGRNTLTGNLDFSAMQGAFGYTFMTGNFGIGTINPNYLLEVNGTAAKPGGGTWIAASDAKLKQSVISYTDGLSSLLKIKPVKFHYNEKSGYDTLPEYVGVLAQELKETAPYMVGTYQRNDETFFNVDNSAMIYMLINSVKEQQKQIEELKSKNENLRTNITSIEGDMKKIKAQMRNDIAFKK